MAKIRVLLIEDNRLLREGITAMLNEQPDIRVVSATGNGDALEKAKKIKPQVVLLDLGLRNQNSLRIAELIKKEYPKPSEHKLLYIYKYSRFRKCFAQSSQLQSLEGIP